MAKTIPQLTDATTVNAADELIIQQGGITKRATAAELMNNAPVTATSTTTARPLADRFSDIVNAKDFGAVGNGTTDDYAAIQAAVTYCSDNSKPLYVPAGTYRLSQRVSIVSTTAGWVFANIFGDGINRTVFTVNGSENSSGAFYFSKNGPLLSVTMRDLCIRCKSGSGNCGTALHVQPAQGGSINAPSVILDSIFVDTEDVLVTNTGGVNSPATPAYWSNGIVVKHSSRPFLRRLWVNNPKANTNDNSIRYKNDSVNYLGSVGIDVSDCYGPLVEECRATQFQTGFYAYSDNVAVEGGTFLNITAVNVKNGIYIDATTASGVEPGLYVAGSHINFRDYGVYINKRKSITVKDILFYHQNTLSGTTNYGSLPVDIYVPNGFEILVSDNKFQFDSGVERTGVYVANFTAGNGVEPNLRLNANSFDATFDPAIRIDSFPNYEQFVEPEVASNWFGFNVKKQILIGTSTQKTAPYTQQLLSDTYTPVVVSGTTTNIDVIAPQSGYFTRIGNIVNAWGVININPTSAGTVCEFIMEPPQVLQFPATSMTAGVSYEIAFVGTSNFTSFGASANTVGTVFTATAAGTGTGMVRRKTYLSTANTASGEIRHINTSTSLSASGLIYPDSGNLKCRVTAHGTANAAYSFNVSYVIE
jgi:hypothetical protein